MGRPLSYDRDAVVDAAQLVFWERGYEATGIDDVEQATGLSRSSLYAAFGTKRSLFDEVLANYGRTFLTELLAPIERQGAGPADAVALLVGLGRRYEQDLGRRGCLIINAIGELGGRFDDLDHIASDLLERYKVGFCNALAGADGPRLRRSQLERRADALRAAAVGAWTASRIEPSLGADLARSAAGLVGEWYGVRVPRS
jgi:TetR/AcrR family transcriptional regulator, transcriptional repressor for nem operon